jgi:hypothetical protein
LTRNQARPEGAINLDLWSGQPAAPAPLTEADRTAKGDMRMLGNAYAYAPSAQEQGALGKMSYSDSAKAAAPMASDAQAKDWEANPPAQREMRGGFVAPPALDAAGLAQRKQDLADQQRQIDAGILRRGLMKAAFNPGMDRVSPDGSIDTSLRQNAMAGLSALAQNAATPREVEKPSTALEEARTKGLADVMKAQITADGGLATVQAQAKATRFKDAFPAQEAATMPGQQPTGYTPYQQGWGMQQAAALSEARPGEEDQIIGAVKQAATYIIDPQTAQQQVMMENGANKITPEIQELAQLRARESEAQAQAFLAQLYADPEGQ